ncbi:MAG: monofunctional biosynthetic peptidoglycan transglycosylase [Bacteroidales bacterium]|nr:monofunctional biosynthetic peptidoglycan transglycosylase [Bacteroidales bacterium]
MKKNIFHRFLRLVLLWIPLGFIVLTFLWVFLLKWLPPVATPLMVQRAFEYRADKDFKTKYKWVPYERISAEMARAVIASEDNLFFEHDGFDRKAINKAIQDKKAGKAQRGGSSISQQTAKNVFCSHRRDFVRKAFETYFTILIEWMWGKERILEVYLNVAEMGKGIYGAEAAAQAYWSKPASELSRRQACLLAVCLPAPLNRSPVKPGSYVSRQAGIISSRENSLSYPDWIYHK